MTNSLSNNSTQNSYPKNITSLAKILTNKAIILGSVIALSVCVSNAKIYKIDRARSSLEFKAVYMAINKTKGTFDTYSGNVDFDEKSRTLKVLKGEMDMNSVNTKNQQRDKHLREAEFLNVEKFPKGKFVMKSIKGNKLTADLTLRGVTKSVVFDYELNGPEDDPMKQRSFINIELKGKINRKDFGIGNDSTLAEASLKNEIEIYIEIGAHETND